MSDKQSLCRFFIKRQLVAQSVQVCHAAFGAEVCYEFYTDMLVVYRLVEIKNMDFDGSCMVFPVYGGTGSYI